MHNSPLMNSSHATKNMRGKKRLTWGRALGLYWVAIFALGTALLLMMQVPKDGQLGRFDTWLALSVVFCFLVCIFCVASEIFKFTLEKDINENRMIPHDRDENAKIVGSDFVKPKRAHKRPHNAKASKTQLGSNVPPPPHH